MKQKSLQQVEDFYVDLGYRGAKLRQALKVDKNYQELLKAKKQKLTSKIKVSPAEKKKYVLSTDIDFEILYKCNELKNLDLKSEDMDMVNLIKAQLEDDWRKPLVLKLNQFLRKYKK
ncbi:MAG: hypothetical protein HQ539_00520 [Parcubacteria group bacterium]|nr:hypothetical protein [Parcubacteria group bacterium]